MVYKFKARLSVKQSSFNRKPGWQMPSMGVFNALVDPKVRLSFHNPGSDVFLMHKGLVLSVKVNWGMSVIRIHLFLTQVFIKCLTYYADSIPGAKGYSTKQNKFHPFMKFKF